MRCGWELVENATRFARHITRCPSATDADRFIARDHLAGMAPEQIQAINDNAELARAFSLGGKAHVRSLFEDTDTVRHSLKCPALHSPALNWIVLYHNALHCTPLPCTALACTALH